MALGTCESCGKQKTEVFAVDHHQEGNEKKWNYCEHCTLVHNIEVDLQKELVEMNKLNPELANSPAFVAEKRAEVTKRLLAESKK